MLADMLSDLEDLAAAAAWMDGALCAEADPEAFFPPDQAGPAWWEPAVRLCRSCPVREACLNYALANEIPWGVWGGLRQEERRRIAGSLAVA